MPEDPDIHRPLLVPINIEALAVGQCNGLWTDLSPDFSMLWQGKILGSQLTPTLFDPRPRDPENPRDTLHLPGVHLHWALPDALTHGRQVRGDSDDEPEFPPEFPCIPNRWLVLRILTEEKKRAVRLRTWVIESDFLVTPDPDTGEPTPENVITFPKLDTLPLFAYVGKCFEADAAEWREGPDRTCKIKNLTALGYGDPAFAAYYPACRSMLGFHDPLKDVPAGTALTYMVLGWYSDPAEDPLDDGGSETSAAQRLARLKELKWSVTPPYPLQQAEVKTNRLIITGYGDLSDSFPIGATVEILGGTANDGSYTILDSAYESPDFTLHVNGIKEDATGGMIAPPATVYPNRTLCHGLLYNLTWEGPDFFYASERPVLDENNCAIAVGNTSAEALAALLAEKCGADGEEDLINALQGDILAKNSAPGELMTLLHQNRFRSYRGGRLFTPRKKTVAGGPAGMGSGGFMPEETEQDIVIPEEIRQKVAILNELETLCTGQKRKLKGYRWELYATWHKQVLGYLEHREESPDRFADQIEALRQRIAEEEKLLADNLIRREASEKALREAFGEQFTELELMSSSAQPFLQANDPVLLIAAEGMRPSLRHGHDGRYSREDELHCRLNGQEISALCVDIPEGRGGIRVCPEEIWDIPGLPWKDDRCGAPVKTAERLLKECLLLNPAHGEEIAQQVYKNEGVASRSGLERVKEEIRKLQRQGASARSESSCRVAGRLPSPVTFRDRDEMSANPWLPLFLQWRLSWRSSYGGLEDALTDWSLDGEDYQWEGSSPTGSETSPIYEGYTILTPSAISKFKEALKDWNAENPAPELDAIITRLGEMNILSQMLGGFSDALVMRDAVLQMPPIKIPPRPGVEILDPIAALIKGEYDASPEPDPDKKPFLPIRAGHAELLSLSIVDAFGQTLEVPPGCLQQPIRAASLMTRGKENRSRIQFPPRIVQPLRLNFSWLPAVNPRGPCPEDSPICGWITPNHLDKSLLFFDGQGRPLGALQRILRTSAAGGTGVRPENLKAFFRVPWPGTAMNPADIMNPELRNFIAFLEEMDADRGRAFWDLLDDALGKMDSGEPADDPLLSMLVGRPLALVRISLALELAGLPVFNQAWDRTGEYSTDGFTRIKFPLLLGEALNENDGLVGYFREAPASGPIGPFYPAAGGLTTPYAGRIDDNVPLELDCQSPLILTLLMAPETRVHARTGLLPKTYCQLPRPFRSAVKTVKNVFFQAAPILSQSGDLRMPKPSDDFGKWSWACRPQVTLWKEYDKIEPAGDRAGFSPVRQEIFEGWLKLELNPMAIFNFWVQEGREPVPPQTEITLAWAVQGGSRLSLWATERGRDPVLKWEKRPPFDRRFRTSVVAETTYTLTLADEEGRLLEKKLTVTPREDHKK